MKIAPKIRSTATTRQRGFVMVTAIMLLVILTLVVLSLMRTSILEERMVGNHRDWNTAFQSAESALRDAEREILESKRTPPVAGETGFPSSYCGADGLCRPNTCLSSTDCAPIWVKLAKTDSLWREAKAGPSNTIKSVPYGAYTNAVALPGFPAPPRYIIEALTVPGASGSLKVNPGGSASNTIYRITAVGFGLNTSSRVMLQSLIRPN
jgi:type IV pilus assembly protein PilX